MKSWDQLFSYVKKDFHKINNKLTKFLIVYFLISIIYFFGSYIFSKYLSTNIPIFLLYFLYIIVYSIGMFINQYNFQQQYSKQVNIPADIVKFKVIFTKLLKLYMMQFAICTGIVVGIILVFFIPLSIFNINQEIIGLIMPIVTISLVVFILLWFYRLLFVSYILVYNRNSYRIDNVIKESKYILKNNKSIIITVIVLYLMCSIPQGITNFTNHNFINTNYFSTFLFIILGMFSTYIFSVLTINTIIEHKYCFDLTPKNYS